MAWNGDATRMPYRMHSEDLRCLFLDNDLAEGRFVVRRRRIALSDIQVPIFSVGTIFEHVAPWRSVFKIQLLTETDGTFVLTSGRHNAGIVSEPGHGGRTYQILTTSSDHRSSDPEASAAGVQQAQGSGWPAWLAAPSGPVASSAPLGSPSDGFGPLSAAPGTYMFQE